MLLIISEGHGPINYAFLFGEEKTHLLLFFFFLTMIIGFFEHSHPLVSHSTLIYTITISMTPIENFKVLWVRLVPAVLEILGPGLSADRNLISWLDC